MFGGSSEYTAFHDVGSVLIFLFFTKGTVRELQDSNSEIPRGGAGIVNMTPRYVHDVLEGASSRNNDTITVEFIPFAP